jgi:hypothetical protein
MRGVRTTAVTIAAILGLAGVRPAWAHDVHSFGGVTVALGWAHEPAYVGVVNAVQVLVRDQAGRPITGITDKDLTVEVSLGRQRMDAKPLLPTARPDTGLGTPGEYRMELIPTAPGAYTFHITGTVSGQPIDETVTASDTTFDTVKDATTAEWPARLPALSEVATRVERIGTRVPDAMAASASAKDAADHGQLVGDVGLVIAVLALGLTFIIGGLAGRRRAG